MAQQHPRFPIAPLGSTSRVEYIFALVALECDAAESRLLALYQAELKKNCLSRQTEKSLALWEAFIALRDKAKVKFEQARVYGQLPYAFHGTRAFISAEVAA